jgi:two-component system sensor histidine kinase MtrB
MRPGGFRRRLIIAFVLVAAVSAGALAAASFALVRQARLTDFLHAKAFEARVDLEQAQGLKPTPQVLSPAPNGFLQEYGRPTLLIFPGRDRVPSDPAVDPPIPGSLRRLAATGQLGYTTIDEHGTPYLVIGGRAAGSVAQLYFFFSEAGLDGELGQFRNALIAGWVGVVVLALLVGRALARRTLEPVARASLAAKAIATGQLGTRLEIRGRDEFGAWAVAFNDMADALEAKIAALSSAQQRERRFTSDVAHELRTPVTALVAEASLLAGHVAGLPESARRPTELLITDVRRLRTLVDDLMEISRLDAGTEPAQVQRVELRDFAATVLAARAWDAGVALAGGPVDITTDPRRLERIVVNLVGNALEHGRVDVTVAIGLDGGVAYVDVADAGPGVAAEHIAHLFERFYKADPARTGPGSGLGLAIAIENAKLLGGDISVSSELGHGCVFRLTLPLESES